MPSSIEQKIATLDLIDMAMDTQHQQQPISLPRRVVPQRWSTTNVSLPPHLHDSVANPPPGSIDSSSLDLYTDLATNKDCSQAQSSKLRNLTEQFERLIDTQTYAPPKPIFEAPNYLKVAKIPLNPVVRSSPPIESPDFVALSPEHQPISEVDVAELFEGESDNLDSSGMSSLMFDRADVPIHPYTSDYHTKNCSRSICSSSTSKDHSEDAAELGTHNQGDAQSPTFGVSTADTASTQAGIIEQLHSDIKNFDLEHHESLNREYLKKEPHVAVKSHSEQTFRVSTSASQIGQHFNASSTKAHPNPLNIGSETVGNSNHTTDNICAVEVKFPEKMDLDEAQSSPLETLPIDNLSATVGADLTGRTTMGNVVRSVGSNCISVWKLPDHRHRSVDGPRQGGQREMMKTTVENVTLDDTRAPRDTNALNKSSSFSPASRSFDFYKRPDTPRPLGSNSIESSIELDPSPGRRIRQSTPAYEDRSFTPSPVSQVDLSNNHKDSQHYNAGAYSASSPIPSQIRKYRQPGLPYIRSSSVQASPASPALSTRVNISCSPSPSRSDNRHVKQSNHWPTQGNQCSVISSEQNYMMPAPPIPQSDGSLRLKKRTQRCKLGVQGGKTRVEKPTRSVTSTNLVNRCHKVGEQNPKVFGVARNKKRAVTGLNLDGVRRSSRLRAKTPDFSVKKHVDFSVVHD